MSHLDNTAMRRRAEARRNIEEQERYMRGHRRILRTAFFAIMALAFGLGWLGCKIFGGC